MSWNIGITLESTFHKWLYSRFAETATQKQEIPESEAEQIPNLKFVQPKHAHA